MRVTSYPAVSRIRVGGASHSGLQQQWVSTPVNRVQPRRLNRRDAQGPARVQYLGFRITCRASRKGFSRRSATPVIGDTYRPLLPQRVENALGPGVASIQTPWLNPIYRRRYPPALQPEMQRPSDSAPLLRWCHLSTTPGNLSPFTFHWVDGPASTLAGDT
jgi:hypothetical protein